MYGLPSDFSPSFLEGKTLDMVCFTAYQAYLHLSDGILISVEGEMSVDRAESFQLRDAFHFLYPLIDQRIEIAKANSTGAISLIFEKGTTLQILDSSDRYESFSIAVKGETVVRV